MADIQQSEQATHILFSVCASADVTLAVTAACAEISGTEFVGEFHDYFTPERRPQMSQTVKEASACVAIVDCDKEPEQALVTMERLRAMGLKNLSVVGYATRMEANFLLRAMRAGCNEFLAKPADAAVLREALQRFQTAHLVVTGAENAGRIITFCGVKGGVGTTTLAVHLANNLVRRHRKRTLLIDHAHELGHVALLLGLKDSQYHFDELVRNADRLDGDLLNGFVSRHTSGLEVLTSPDACAPQHKSSAEELELVFNFLRKHYEYVIVDSSLTYKEIQASMLRNSDELCLVSTPDVAALRDMARRIEHMSLDEEAAMKLRIIINRSTSDDAVSPEQIESVVKFPVWLSIPNAYAELVRAINAGEPIPAESRSPFAQHINKWATKLTVISGTRVEKPSAPKKRFAFWRTSREQMA